MGINTIRGWVDCLEANPVLRYEMVLYKTGRKYNPLR